MTNLLKNIYMSLLMATIVLPGSALSDVTKNKSIFSGYYAREGNNGTPSRTLHHNVYMKLYADGGHQWVAMMHIPLPYASTVDESLIPKIFKKIRTKINTSAFVRDTFGYLEERATVQFERFGYMQDKLIFECGSLSPCSIIPSDGYLELIKPGMINEHIIKYNHITD